MGYHNQWKGCHYLADDDWGVDAHRLGLLALHEATVYDNLYVCNLVCMELVLRQVQRIEYAYGNYIEGLPAGKGGKSRRVPEKAAVLGNYHIVYRMAMACPEFLGCAAKEAERDAIKPQNRKTRKELAHRSRRAPGGAVERENSVAMAVPLISRPRPADGVARRTWRS